RSRTLRLRHPCCLLGLTFHAPYRDPATPETPTPSLHDALPISPGSVAVLPIGSLEQHGEHLPLGTDTLLVETVARRALRDLENRSEEHTSELQSRFDLVCRLLLEKKTLPVSASRVMRRVLAEAA